MMYIMRYTQMVYSLYIFPIFRMLFFMLIKKTQKLDSFRIPYVSALQNFSDNLQDITSFITKDTNGTFDGLVRKWLTASWQFDSQLHRRINRPTLVWSLAVGCGEQNVQEILEAYV